MDSSVFKDPNFWQFLEMIWKDHPLFFMIIVFWVTGLIGCKITKDNSFIEFWINGLTPKGFRKQKAQNRRKSDQSNEDH